MTLPALAVTARCWCCDADLVARYVLHLRVLECVARSDRQSPKRDRLTRPV